VGGEPGDGEPASDTEAQATLRWSPRSAADLAKIKRRIAIDNPTAAASLIARIYEAAQVLEVFPRMGRVGRPPDTYELVIAGTDYIVAYRIRDDVVHVLTVRHGARLWPGRL
jgi:toxin ParE1/3/4